MSSIIIVGAGGFGLEVAAYIEDIEQTGLEDFEVKGFLDDTKPVGALHGSYPVLGGTNDDVDAEAQYVIALGDPQARKKLAEKLAAKGATFVTLIHPMAYVAATAQIGNGCIFAPFSFVGPEARIADHAYLNIYASAAHECSIGKYCGLAPYAGTHASSNVGEEVLLASHSVVTHGVKIGAKAKLSAGAVAFNDVPEGALALGNPARHSVQN